MGTIAEKLTYLNTTKTMLKDSLNKFGSNILTTDTFRSYDTKLNDIYDKLPKITQSGAGFTLENVQNGLLDDFKMIGVDLEQDTTTGKNLFDKDNANIITAYIGDSYNWTFSGSAICYRINCKPNTSYTISCANSNETIFRGSVTDSEDIPTSGNNLSIYSTVRRTNNSPITVNTGANAKYVLVQLSNTQYLTSLETLQVEEGSSVTSYEPYTRGPSPNPDYPQEIKVVEGRQVITDKGKNLFDKDNITKLNGTININSNDFEGGGLNYAVCISCKPNTTYTVTKRNDGNTNRFALASSETIPSSTISELTPVLNKIRDNDSSTLTLTTEISANYLIVQYYRSAESILTEQQILDSIQLEEGSSSTNFEPYYNPVSYNIDLHGKNIFDGQYEDGYYNMNGTKSSTQDPYGRRSTNLNEIKPNTNYIISINNNIISEAIRLFYYDVNRGFISTESISNGTFTSPAECYYVSWHSSSLKQNYPDGIPNMMIEQGQTITTYEDYYDYKLAKMPNTDYKNRIYKNNGNWYYEKNIEKIILDGIVNLFLTKTGNAGNVYTINQLNDLKSTSSNDEVVNAISNYFIADAYSNLGNLDNGIVEYRGSQVIRFKFGTNSSVDTLNKANEWLQNNNVLLYYVLGNPVTTQITNATLINQLEAISVHTGTNIITISNDNNIIPEIEITRLKELEKLA